MRKFSAKPVALGGMLAAAAVVIMGLGGLIPIATYVCPLLCMLILTVVLRICGGRIAWAWYVVVALLSLLLGPDKEAAAVFVFLGYYPIVKPKLDGRKLSWLWKGLLFNSAVVIMYALLMHLFGMAQLAEEFTEMGTLTLVILLVLGNVTFVLLDKILDKFLRRKKGRS
jgi:hypothetical protein